MKKNLSKVFALALLMAVLCMNALPGIDRVMVIGGEGVIGPDIEQEIEGYINK